MISFAFYEESLSFSVLALIFLFSSCLDVLIIFYSVFIFGSLLVPFAIIFCLILKLWFRVFSLLFYLEVFETASFHWIPYLELFASLISYLFCKLSLFLKCYFNLNLDDSFCFAWADYSRLAFLFSKENMEVFERFMLMLSALWRVRIFLISLSKSLDCKSFST